MRTGVQLSELQAKVKEWQGANFGEVQVWELVLGACEEVGELAHCVLKRHRSMDRQEDLEARMRDAIGDIVVFLMGVCEEEKWDIGEIIKETVGTVVERKWVE